MSPALYPGAEPAVSALLVGRYDSDQQVLHDVLRNLGWTVFEAEDAGYALSYLRRNPVHVVIADAGIPQRNWKEILESVGSLKPAPLLIVTSRTADDHLWAEVLNMGGFDVLAQPFDRVEVERVLASARRRFHARPALSVSEAPRHRVA